MNRIDQTFQRCSETGRKAFVAYLTAGDPNPDATPDLVLALERAGADIVELGIPFSDPLADGAVNQMAAQRALDAGTTANKILEIIRNIRSRSEIPLVLFTYLNPIYAYGFDLFQRDAASAGADGMLILDLPPEEAAANRELAANAGLHMIRLVAPTTPPDRARTIVGSATGFIYYVSREGVTGEQSSLAGNIASGVATLRAMTPLPIAVGFGISTPGQAAEVARHADGVVVGSAIVRQIAAHGEEPDLAARLETFVRPLAEAVKAS